MADPETWGRGVTTRPSRYPPAVLARVREARGDRCYARFWSTACACSGPLEVDHLQPLSRGGDNHWTNLAFTCRTHNRSKHNRSKPR